MRPAIPALLVLLLHLLPPAPSADDGLKKSGPESASPVRLSTWQPVQGDPVIVEASVPPGADDAVMVWKGREIPMRREAPGRFLGLIGIDLQEPPGKAVLSVRSPRGGQGLRFDAEISVREGTFPVQELTLPRTMTEFDGPTLGRINREAKALADRFSRPPADPAWRFPFLAPVADFRPRGFGARRIINGEPRSPHAGVDVNLPAGTPVVAIADGTVALAGEQFFAGKSVVLDHGGSLFSIYYHLEEYTVSEGERVARGDRIGAVGSSGRATGPHLHFGIRAAGGRIDPALLYALPAR